MTNKIDVLYFVIKGAICLCAVPFLPVASAATFIAVGFLSLACGALFAIL